MHAEIISPRVIAAHDVAAARVADSYVRDLAADTTASLKWLASYIQTFRSEIAAEVYEAAARNRCPGLKVRFDLVERLARGHVKRAVTGTALAAKLLAIRAEQDRRAQAEIAAEQASWEPLPLG